MMVMRHTWPAPTMRMPSTSSVYTVVVNILVRQTTGHDWLSVGLEFFVQSARTGNRGTEEPPGPATTVRFKLVAVQFSYQFFTSSATELLNTRYSGDTWQHNDTLMLWLGCEAIKAKKDLKDNMNPWKNEGDESPHTWQPMKRARPKTQGAVVNYVSESPP